MAPHFFDAPDSDVAARTALGHAALGTSDIGPILEAPSRIADGDATGWNTAWREQADRLRAEAVAAREAGHDATASALYLSASEFYDQALAFVDGMRDTSVLLPTFRDHRAAWDDVVATSGGRHLPVPVPVP